jgi:beta-lactamase class D
VRLPVVLLALLLAASAALPAQARTLCTIVADAATGNVLHETGDCDSRVTPASTFKIPLALIGFDSGVLIDSKTPVWPFKKGYPDWGGAAWQQDVGPAHWMKHSVLWYSQQLTARLGMDHFASAVTALDYGNADLSGDPGQDNALERSWISSSLKISPREQLGFLRRLLAGDLPVSPAAMAATREIVGSESFASGWTIWGKTGSAYPRHADGSFDRRHGWGWFVGWGQRGGTTLVFARLTQDEGGESGSAGLRTRSSLLRDWSSLLP